MAEAAAGGGAQGEPEAGPASSGGAASPVAGLGPGGANLAGSGGTGAPAGADLEAYAVQLDLKVAREKRYPAIAARLGMEGTARVRVRVRREGSMVGRPSLAGSTGHEVLDAEALRMVEAAAPFAPLPEGLARSEADFIIRIRFSLAR